MNKIYVASKASIPERSKMWRSLRDAGAPIISTWIDEAGEGQTLYFSDLWSRIQEEIERSTRLVLYVEASDFPMKGALVEIGMAMSRDIPVRIVAPFVEIDKNGRPFGSWIFHPIVTFHRSIQDAMS